MVARALQRSLALVLTLASIALGASAVAQAQTAAEVDSTLDTLFGSHAPFADFLGALQRAVAADDRQAVAAMVDYPFHARIAGKAASIKDASHFVDAYYHIVTAKVKHAIAEQRYAKLFANWQGVMIGDGEVWFSLVGKPGAVRITAINP